MQWIMDGKLFNIALDKLKTVLVTPSVRVALVALVLLLFLKIIIDIRISSVIIKICIKNGWQNKIFEIDWINLVKIELNTIVTIMIRPNGFDDLFQGYCLAKIKDK